MMQGNTNPTPGEIAPPVMGVHLGPALIQSAWQFASGLTGKLSSYFATRVKVIPASPTRLQYLGNPVCWMTLGKLAGQSVLLEAESKASFLIIEGMLGGRLTGITTMKRGFTPIELELLGQFAQVAGQAFEGSGWNDSSRFFLDAGIAEKQFSYPTACKLHFLIKAGDAQASFALLVPNQPKPIPTQESKPDGAELKAVIQAGELSSTELSALAPGALLIVENGIDPEVIVQLGGSTAYKGKLRSHRGHKVVIITERLNNHGQADMRPPATSDESRGA